MKNVTAAILCGGRASRMGGVDKGLVELNSKPLIEYVLAVLTERFDSIIINANRNLEQYSRFSFPVIKDDLDDFQGPLSGMLASLRQMKTEWLLTVPCDTPLLTVEVIDRMLEKLSEKTHQTLVAHDGNRMQPMFSLLHKSKINSLSDFLVSGERKVSLWFDAIKPEIVNLQDLSGLIVNINSQQELSHYQKGDRHSG